MHELSIAMSIVDLAEEEAEQRGAQINAIHLKLGALAGVVKAALLSSFEMASYDTVLQGARLVIVDVPVVIFCSNCSSEQTPKSSQHFSCPVCQTPSSQIIHGKELEVVALEIQ
jgi:hydrogenase nickel incorporation protein HypA/HybF